MPIAKIALLFSALSLILLGFGALIGYFLGDLFVWLSVFFLIAIAMNLFSYFKSDSIAIKMTRSKIIDRPENTRFYDIVEKVSQQANIPMPRVGIMPTDVPNAFATGKDENHSVVVATSGILKMLDDNELEAVIGHEISHITHKDILISTIAATIATLISYIGNVILFSEFFGGLDERNNGSGIILIVAAILIPIGAMFVQLGISRDREAYADEGSVRLLRKPDQLISSLQKISNVSVTSKRSAFSRNRQSNPQPGAYSSLFIVNNFSAHSLMNLFSTHPTLEKRIKNINRVRDELNI
ncbi:MAG: M48 family metalloprotease [Candidatus Parvarchaeota archaeon]|jgi:heat shock protein HtpX|nr:M48 family metalloprotease [Candidatus Parvarchaeota archaeon]MCL5106664.1 M48 family metalloprotease [Candidatus Parvarchaeota archaeon]